MSKKSSSKGGRVSFPNANTRIAPPPFRVTPTNLQIFEDRRVFHPLNTFANPITIGPRDSARVVVRDLNKARKQPGYKTPRQTKGILTFAAPDKVVLCVRRQRRKEVLHAIRKTGSGAGRQKKPKRNYWSKISCRRK